VQLASLHLYPVKSLRGLSVARAEIDALGIVGDRRFLVVDADGQFLTQRAHSRMALIETALSGGVLTLRAAKLGEVQVGCAPDSQADIVRVRLWSDAGLAAEDCGPEPAALLSAFLDAACRLVRIGPAFHRPVRPSRAKPGDQMAFADGFPFLAIGDGTLDALNRRLAAAGAPAVPMNRFRPNLVFSGCPAHAEDQWPHIRVGEIDFRSAGPCKRCVITTIDQATAERGPEPLRTLAAYRRNASDPTHVDFGLNLIHETKCGVLRIGDSVEV